MNVKYGLLVEKKEFKLKKDYAKEIFINFNDQDVNNIIGTVFYYSLRIIKINYNDSSFYPILDTKLINSEYDNMKTKAIPSKYFHVTTYDNISYTRNTTYLKINKFIKNKDLKYYIYLINNDSIIKLLDNESMYGVMEEYIKNFINGIKEI